MACTLELRNKEKLHGTFVSVLAGGLYFGAISIANALKLDKSISVPVLTFAINFVGHALDIIVAKKCFTSFSNGDVNIYPYTPDGIRLRGAWYLRSLFTASFLRFILLSYTDSIVVTRIFEILDAQLDDWGVMDSGWALTVRDPLVLGFLGVATFLMYVNILRFEWAYTTQGDLAITTLVVFWACFMTFGTSPKVKVEDDDDDDDDDDGGDPPAPPQE